MEIGYGDENRTYVQPLESKERRAFVLGFRPKDIGPAPESDGQAEKGKAPVDVALFVAVINEKTQKPKNQKTAN